MFPLNEVAPLARSQLAAWEELAKDWVTYADADTDTGILVARCASCHAGVWRITDEAGNSYRYTAAQLLALKVAHLRLAHQDLDPDR